MGIFKDIFGNKDSTATLKTIITISVISCVLVFLTFNFFFEFSAFAVAMLKSILAFTLLWSIDRFAIPEIDTMKELKEGNYAYAIFLLAIAVVIGSAMLSS